MCFSSEDRMYMQRCLQLAANGRGTASPNPMVGSILVQGGEIIGEGWHLRAGEPHAEPNAIASVRDRARLKDATLYVNLEPCSHYGKTPPCVELIIREQIPRVVIGSLDPFPLVSGRGVACLREAGVEVVLGVEELACLELNKDFIGFHQKKRPRIVLKWAQTADGFIDWNRTPGDGQSPLSISNAYTQILTHKLRSESDAILVGTRTAILDNPSLNVRLWSGRNPLRIVLDRLEVVPPSANVFDGKQETLLFTEGQSRSKGMVQWVHLDFDSNMLGVVMDELYRRNKLVLLVEGGTKIHESFIQEDLWDEIHVETSPLRIGVGVPAPKIGVKWLNHSTNERIGQGSHLREIRTYYHL